MLSAVRLQPSTRLQCADYDLDRFVVELDDGDLDFRLELGLSVAIYWALPAGYGDRLRLALVDGAAFHVDEPILEADPFVFDLPRTEWHGELGQLHDGSVVTGVVFEASVAPPAYRCEVTLRSATGDVRTKQFAWREPVGTVQRQPRASDEEVARLGLSVAMQRALAEDVPKVAAWDRNGRGVSVVAVAAGFPAQLVAIQAFEEDARDTLEAYALDHGAWIGATCDSSRVVWVIDGERCQIWHEGELCCLEGDGAVVRLADRTLDASHVTAVVSFSDPTRRNHRGLALRLGDGTLVKVVEHADSDAAPRIATRPEREWTAYVGRDLAAALAVPWLDDVRSGTDHVFAPAPPAGAAASASVPERSGSPTLRGLLDACRAAPDDDGPRLAWARAVGGERGELVVLQCELARANLSHDETMTRRRRVRDLLDRHGSAWSGLAGLASAVRFDRGFVSAADVPVTQWLERSDLIRDIAPLLTALKPGGLDASSDGSGDGARDRVLATLDRLLADPAFRALEAVDLGGVGVEVVDDDGPNWWHSLGDAVVSRLVDQNLLAGLRGLVLGPVEPSSLRALGDCNLTGMEVLEVRCERANNEQWAQLLSPARLPSLRALQLDISSYVHFDIAQLLDALPATLVELGFVHLSTGSFTRLAQHAIARQLERLSIHGATIGNTHLFASFPRLRSLDLSRAYGQLGGEVTASTMPALRELAYFASASDTTFAQLASLADRFGAQLELLDLRGLDPYRKLGSDAFVAGHVARLRERMTGVVLRQDAAPSPRLPHLSRSREADYWAVAVI